MREIVIPVGAARLAAVEEGDGPPFVLLHAGIADRRSFLPVLPRLAGRAVAWDRRGFGDTRYEPEPYAHVDDLLAVLDACAIERATLVGSSQGGRIAIDFALAHPDRVQALVLAAPAISGAPEPDLPVWVREIAEAIDRSTDPAEVCTLEVHAWLDGYEQPRGRVGGAVRDLVTDMNRRALAAPSPGEERAPSSAWWRLSEIAVPTRVVVGDLDLPHVLANARHVAALVPEASLRVMPGTAHLPYLEQPEAFVRAAFG